MPARVASHTLPATPSTCFWGFFDSTLPPVLEVDSGDDVSLELLTHQAGDAPDLMMDEGARAVYEGIPQATRRPGVHIMTGPIAVRSAEPGDLNQAMRQAALEMLAFLTATQRLSRDDAYSLMSVAADFGITQVVDYRQGVHCGVPKSVFAAL